MISVGSEVQILPGPPIRSPDLGSCARWCLRPGDGGFDRSGFDDPVVLVGEFQGWGHSSAGRAPALQAGGHRFDPDCLHHHRLQSKRCKVSPRPITAIVVCAANDESRSPDNGDEDTNWLLKSVSRMIEFGVNARLGIMSRVCVCAVLSATFVGCVVLWQCESGSGASLGACDSRSVCEPVAGPVVQPCV